MGRTFPFCHQGQMICLLWSHTREMKAVDDELSVKRHLQREEQKLGLGPHQCEEPVPVSVLFVSFI